MHSERDVGFEYGKMIGRSLILAIASMTWRLNSFGTVLTPMIPVGLKAFIASTKVGYGLPMLDERLLKLGEIGARGDKQAIDVE